MEEIHHLGKQIDFDNLAYHYKGKTVPRKFMDFKGSLGFSRSIKEGQFMPQFVIAALICNKGCLNL